MLHTLAHELVHHIREQNAEEYKVLADFLMEQYGKKGVSVDALVRRQMEKAKASKRIISYAEAHEEVVADSMETMLTDGKVIEKLQKLQEKAIKLSNSVTFYDKKLLNLESTSFLKNVLEREKKKAIKRQKESNNLLCFVSFIIFY